MKRFIVLITALSAVLILTACGEPPALNSSFTADFTTSRGGTDYEGTVRLDDSGLTVTMTEPYTIAGLSFRYTADGMSISEGGLTTEANSDYIPTKAIPSALHDSLAYIAQAEYNGIEDGEDKYTLPTPYGSAEITASEGMIKSLCDSSGQEFCFSNAE